MKCHHLTAADRGAIQVLLQKNYTQKDIALEIGVSPSPTASTFQKLYLNSTTGKPIFNFTTRTFMEIELKKMVFGGQALGHFEDKTVLAWNALPGERVKLRVTKKKKNLLEGVAEEIIVSSPERQPAREEHFLSTSPWQIISPKHELLLKKNIALETYQKLGGFQPEQLLSEEIACVTDGVDYGYRNKMEFSFFSPDKVEHSLAFHQRGGRNRLPVSGSLLAKDGINQVGTQVIKWLNQEQISYRTPKSLIIRENQRGDCVAALFLKDELPREQLERLELPHFVVGLQIFYSSHQSPASRPDKLLLEKRITEWGSEPQLPPFLTEEILNARLAYGSLSFFQVNIPLFTRSLAQIKPWVLPNLPLLDFYCGVGSIGLSLRGNAPECHLVDNHEDSLNFARFNVQHNQAVNYYPHLVAAEKIVELIQSEQTLLLDPPRAGLHPKVVERLNTQKPRRIIYLSCNVSTQARDLGLLLENNEYVLRHCSLYNYFPRTPHIEALCVLDHRQA